MRQIVLGVILLLLVCKSVVAQATTYYISPTGSDSSDGLSPGAPFLTFAYALNPTRASCGDTLNLANGVYGDGTSTGKISLSGRECTVGSPLTIRAVNQRKARIHDNGTGQAIKLSSGTAYIIIDGLVTNSTNNDSVSASGVGAPFNADNTHHITVKNSLFYNPNKFTNTSVVVFVGGQDSLVEDSEIYNYHRHCVSFFTSQRMVSRRNYCNPRLGKIPGGFGLDQGPVGSGAAMVTMYPCKNCILENGIGEGQGYINEMNATFGQNLLLSGSKVLGSIWYGGDYGNGIYLTGRDVADDNHSPVNILIAHVAVVNRRGTSACIKASDPVNVTVNRVTCLGNGANGIAIYFNDSNFGAANMSFTATNNVAKGWGGTGIFRQPTIQTFRGTNNFSNSNDTAFNPPAASWGTGNVTTDPQMGTCYAWPPDGSAAATAGVGATILYRYQNGVLTNVPLWDPTTGEFPHGALVAGVNDVAGQSLFDVHKRLNVNTNGCAFPANYGNGVTDVDAPSTPAGLRLF